MASRIERIRLAKEFGWQLDYIDSLDEWQRADIWGYLDGVARVQKHQNQKLSNKNKGRGKRR